MLLTPHILTGVAIIILVQNPILGLIFVLLSHYFLDLFPHRKYPINHIENSQWKQSLPDFLRVFTDMILGLLIVLAAVGFSHLVLMAAFLAIAPDGATLFYRLWPGNILFKWHLKLHALINDVGENKKIPRFWGILTQIAVVILATCLLLRD